MCLSAAGLCSGFRFGTYPGDFMIPAVYCIRSRCCIASLLWAATIGFAASGPDLTAADDSSIVLLDKLTVVGKKGDILQKITGDQSRAVDPSQMSVTRAINLVPSLSQQSVDPYGLSDISNYHESFRFRGVEATSGGVPACPVNVEDVPVTGRPGGGAAIYDLENFRDIIVYSGGIPADKGCGIADVGGKINLSILRPDERFGVTAKQEFGSSKFFRRTFLRVNSGEHFSTRGFASYSNTRYDKWKGEGNTDRNNVMLGLAATVKDRVTVEVFGIYNKLKLNPYRPLSFARVADIGANYNIDFSENPEDYYYFGYNRNEFEDRMLLANVSVKLGDVFKLTLKPYFWSDEGYYLETITQPNGQNRIRRWDMDHNLYGGLAQLSGRVAGIDYSVGYLYHNQQRPGPPTSWKIYRVAAGKLVFDKWAIVSNNSRYALHSPLVTAKYAIGPVMFDGGVRYVHFRLPPIITYKATTLGDVSHDDALSSNPAVDEAASSRTSKTLDGFFPNATVTGTLNDAVAAYLSYGKNYVTHVDIYPYFMAQRSIFQRAGITFDRLWKDREMEISHNFETGLRYTSDLLIVEPTAYYSMHNGKQAVLHDPVLGATYPRNDAHAEAYGAELEMKLNLRKNLSCYGSLSYNRFYFTQNINSDNDNSVLHIAKYQVPDAPEFLAKALVRYTVKGFTVSPILRYTSVRYGDVVHKEKINPSTAFDIDLSYNHAFFFLRNVEVSLTFMNVLDRKDIALISTSDYKTLKTSYQPVAPFTVVGSLILQY
jgi:iron complex outermembrane receptor protein